MAFTGQTSIGQEFGWFERTSKSYTSKETLLEEKKKKTPYRRFMDISQQIYQCLSVSFRERLPVFSLIESKDMSVQEGKEDTYEEKQTALSSSPLLDWKDLKLLYSPMVEEPYTYSPCFLLLSFLWIRFPTAFSWDDLVQEWKRNSTLQTLCAMETNDTSIFLMTMAQYCLYWKHHTSL